MTEYRVRVADDDPLARGLLDALARRGEVEPVGGASGRVLVLGGARSGKSHWAEAQYFDQEIEYVATSWADPDDEEWLERVRLHRDRRPAQWRTVESMDVAGLLRAEGPPLLVDCLAVWLTRILDDVGAWADTPGWRDRLAAEVDGLSSALRDTTRDVILVSNEVGAGIVPATPSGRLFRDELGRLNAQVAGIVDQVWFVVAGIPRRLK